MRSFFVTNFFHTDVSHVVTSLFKGPQRPLGIFSRCLDGNIKFKRGAGMPMYLNAVAPMTTYRTSWAFNDFNRLLVSKAHDASLNRVVAVKVRAPLLASNDVARKSFIREVRAAAAISHKHVVTIHAVDEEKGLLFSVMQFIDGQSLNQRIREAGSCR